MKGKKTETTRSKPKNSDQFKNKNKQSLCKYLDGKTNKYNSF